MKRDRSVCPVCGKRFEDENGMGAHVADAHPLIAKEIVRRVTILRSSPYCTYSGGVLHMAETGELKPWLTLEALAQLGTDHD